MSRNLVFYQEQIGRSLEVEISIIAIKLEVNVGKRTSDAIVGVVNYEDLIYAL